MPSGNVLRGARVAGRPVPLGGSGGSAAADERPVHGERALRSAVEAARAAGLAEGEARGESRAEERLRRSAALLEQAAAALESQRLDLLQSARADLVGLAVAMTKRLTRRVLAHDPQVAERALAEALEHTARGEALVLRLHPEDAERMRSGAGAVPLAPERFTLVADESVGRGGCLLETPALRCDATLEAHLDRMAEALGDWRDEAAPADADGPLAAEVADAA